jgi:hypothetical protein
MSMGYVWDEIGGDSDAAKTGACDAPEDHVARHSNNVRKSVSTNGFITSSSGCETLTMDVMFLVLY